VSGAQVWRTALERLRREMTRAQFDAWLRGTQLVETGEDGVAVLRVRTTFAREMLETRFRERIEAAIHEVTNQRCRLRVIVGEAQLDSDEPAAREPARVPEKSVPELATTTRPRPAMPATIARRGATTSPSAELTGPTLFASAGGDPQPAPPASQTRRPVPPAPRRRSSGGAPRSVPSPKRVRAMVGRAAGGPAPASGPAPLPDEPPTPPERPATQARHSNPGGSGRSHRQRDNTTWQDESDGYEAMSESSELEARRVVLPASGSRDGRGPTPPGDLPAGGQSGSVPTLPRLNPRYTFATFIVGSGNQLAHAASQAVAEAPGQAYNPLFLYGGVGLGKTHLLHAVGHKAIEMSLSVLYVSSETFTNEIINAIRYRTTEEFRSKYRSVDVLLVDDIQFIAGKESTEEEFFHTFNSLYETSKQIVICSDRPPKAIVSMTERLRSRFEWGLIADIQPPDLETRVAILRAKADILGRVVPDDVITYLASRVQSNIRELEGSFNRLFAFAQLQGLPLTVETAKAALASIASDGRQRRVSVADVLEIVAEYFRIPEDDLRGKQRDKHIVVPRQIAMYLMRQETDASLLEIGQSLGGRDHSTVLHGCEKITREMNENTAMRKEVLAIRQQLLG
jgi:chromosomal replication initiator protein DnaA